MLKAREVLRLKHEVQLSLREIGQACNCNNITVAEVLGRAERAGITWPIELSDKQLMSILYPPLESENSPPEPDMEYVFREMKKKNVTLMLLWEEYKEKYPRRNHVPKNPALISKKSTSHPNFSQLISIPNPPPLK